MAGTILCYFLGGMAIEKFGWEEMFRLVGYLGLLASVMYHFLVQSEPENSKLIGKEELGTDFLRCWLLRRATYSDWFKKFVE